MRHATPSHRPLRPAAALTAGLVLLAGLTALAGCAKTTYLVDDPIAAVASDHYPVVTILNLPKAAPAKGK